MMEINCLYRLLWLIDLTIYYDVHSGFDTKVHIVNVTNVLFKEKLWSVHLYLEYAVACVICFTRWLN